MSNSYKGWDTRSHLETFDLWNKKSNQEFLFSYGCFAEQVYLTQAVRSCNKPHITDVGCATGTTYRFLNKTFGPDAFHYKGVDLSQPAIDRAKQLYPGINFTKKEHEDLPSYFDRRFDIVYSRDTILHQTDPYKFLKELLDISEKYLLLRLRTREKGETVLDINTSCQMHYDQYWMPYIVLNCQELIEFLSAYPGIQVIQINRSFEVLGGYNARFLPKDLYLSETGGAETALSITLDRETKTQTPKVIYDDFIEGHAYLRKNRLKRYAHALVSKSLSKLGAI